MKRPVTLLATAALFATALAVGPAAAQSQGNCPGGKTFTGECINPFFADAMQLNAIIYSQPKISNTAFPIMPSFDWQYRYPNSLIPDPLKPAPARGLAPPG